MAGNTIFKIKRTTISGRVANTTTLSNVGELALNVTDGIMYSTNGSSIFAIGSNNINLNITGTATINAITANNFLGNPGQVLTSNGNGIYWSTTGSTLSSPVRQVYSADGLTNTFTVDGGYSANNLDVYINGVKLQMNIEANVQSGSTFTILNSNPPAGAYIEVVGAQTISANSVVQKTGDTMSGALTVNSNINVSGNLNFLTNNKSLNFKTVNGNNVNFVQQNDDNFVFYSTNTSGGQRPIWAIYANSVTSNLNILTGVSISNNTLGLGSPSIGTNGYTYLPNGLIMQWGRFTCNSTPGGPVSVTFPISFPNNLFSLNITQKHAGSGGVFAFNAESTSGFTCRNSINTGDYLFFQALGN